MWARGSGRRRKGTTRCSRAPTRRSSRLPHDRRTAGPFGSMRRAALAHQSYSPCRRRCLRLACGCTSLMAWATASLTPAAARSTCKRRACPPGASRHGWLALIAPARSTATPTGWCTTTGRRATSGSCSTATRSPLCFRVSSWSSSLRPSSTSRSAWHAYKLRTPMALRGRTSAGWAWRCPWQRPASSSFTTRPSTLTSRSTSRPTATAPSSSPTRPSPHSCRPKPTRRPRGTRRVRRRRAVCWPRSS
mmetsp:Transcript_26113/g.63195  ORF Transcript_26113/g.63195 Transcript_26113/m.63195 type:complete len:248 (-) Transcript_26113:620-1363(-)